MGKVVFTKEKLVLEVEKGTTLLYAIRRAGLYVETPCNCLGTCRKCIVKARGELSPKKAEEELLLGEELRLACITRIEGDVEIELLDEDKNLKTINKGYSIKVELDGELRLNKFTNSNTSLKPLKELLNYKIDKLQAIKKLGEIEAENLKEFYGVVYRDEIIDFSLEHQNIYGVAVDIGTTGLSAYLINLENGEIVSRVSGLNPQTEYGGDVITRITYCMEVPEGIDNLSKVIRNKIDEMVGELLACAIKRSEVYRIVIAANTTMLHLFLGVKPNSIARAPYRGVFLGRQDINPRELSININGEGVLTLLPSASGYVGADILAGVVAVGFENNEKNSIFIDIGTNGEIVLNSSGKLIGASTAAGPAFEGMNIECGLRAEKGAIDSFSIDEDYKMTFTTIGGTEAKGICGSGLIDIAACFVKADIVQKTGRFNPNMPEQLKVNFRDKKFFITEKLYISQKDIRQIQLAKGAISAGLQLLLVEVGIAIDKIEEAIIAGAFGYHINADSIRAIGLIPRGFNGEIKFVGNSSIEGARLALINQGVINRISDLKDEILVMELSTREDFQECFIKELSF